MAQFDTIQKLIKSKHNTCHISRFRLIASCFPDSLVWGIWSITNKHFLSVHKRKHLILRELYIEIAYRHKWRIDTKIEQLSKKSLFITARGCPLLSYCILSFKDSLLFVWKVNELGESYFGSVKYKIKI